MQTTQTWKPTIGLEVHVQLKTRTKLFSAAPYHYGAAPNTQTDAVTLALPGTLPVLNAQALNQCTRLGLMLNCQIAKRCKWDRKQYFYPDSPKNYQISQYDEPLCIGGEITAEIGAAQNAMGTLLNIPLERIHLEEDPGKMMHEGDVSLIDFNRAGVPLAEIVTKPALHSSDEIVAFLQALILNLRYANICDCDLEKGQLRCDVNVSVAPEGSDTLGTRTEMKNLNSLSAAKLAADTEIKRQIKILEAGGSIPQETRRWDMDAQESVSLRGKEDAHDYRYFPDPDLMPVEVPRTTIDTLSAQLPERPHAKLQRYINELALPYPVSKALVGDVALWQFFEATLKALYVSSVPSAKTVKATANFVANDVQAQRTALQADIETDADMGTDTETDTQADAPTPTFQLTPGHLAELITLIENGTISRQIAEDIFPKLCASGQSPAAIVEAEGLAQNNDTSELEALCKDAIAGNPKAAQQFKDGNEKAVNALKGPVMKATQGRANPAQIDAILKQLILEG